MSKYKKQQLKDWPQKAIASRKDYNIQAAMQFVAVMAGMSIEEAWLNTEKLANG